MEIKDNKEITILYLDDERNNLISFKASYRRNFNIITCEKIDEAIKILKYKKIDIVISDQRMPNENNNIKSGVDFLYFVYKNYPSKIRILITAYIDYYSILDSINKSNVFKVINKPYNHDEVLSILNEASYKVLENKNDNLLQELKEKNIELKRTESLYRVLVNNIKGLCVILFDRDYNYLLADGEGLDLNDYLVDNIEGKNMREVLGKEKAEKIIKSYDKSFETKTPLYLNFEKEGRSYHSSFIPIINGIKENDRGMVLVFETTKIKKIEKRLEYKVKELKKANDYLDNFVYAIAHDLKSPVVNIKSLMDLVEMGIRDNDVITNLSKGVSRLDKTLESLVEIIDVQKNTNRKSEVVDFEEIINIVESNIQHHIKDVNPIINYEWKIQKIFFVEGYLLSIFQNLISNSLKYYSKDRKCIINIKAELDKDDTIVLTFKDNGIGISKTDYKNIFKPFNRLSNQTNGKGIGLHIVKSIVEQCGGKIIVNSEIDKGTEFKIYLKEF